MMNRDTSRILVEGFGYLLNGKVVDAIEVKTSLTHYWLVVDSLYNGMTIPYKNGRRLSS